MAKKVGGTAVGGSHDYAIPLQTVGVLLKKYRDRDPDKTALVDLDQDKSITFGQLHEEANRIARCLADMGIGKGDRVAVLSDERLEKLLIWMGIWRLGATIMPLNVEMNISYIPEILRNLGPKLVLWHEDMDVGRMTEGVDCDIVKFTSWGKGMDGDAGSEEFFARAASFAPTPEVEGDYGPDDEGSIYVTSGTTDKPKSFVCTHLGHWTFGLSSVDQLGLTEDDKTLEYRSFGWNSAQGLSLLPWLATGCTLHFAKRYSRSRWPAWVKDNGITFSVGVPTVINMMINSPLGVTSKDMPTLRLMSSSTAPLNPERWQEFEDMYGITLLQFYGSSEGGWVCGNRHNYRKLGTVGPPAKHQEFLIIDEDGNPCPQGTEGEVTLGGPQCAVASMTAEGEWMDLRGKRVHLGDLAVMDDEGFVTVTGRLKDLIIRGGVNISPLEVDNVLLGNAKIHEAAAVGIPDNIYGEEIIAYVVTKPGEILDSAEVLEFCAGRLPQFRMPKQVHFIDELPKNDRGKVRRDDLRVLWEQDHAPA
ncbi:MAG: acyl--CoA ligase [Rhodospirillales bacterium]|nr:acyl--CoA ligase [Rhodospirillales bacterium]